MSSQAGFHRELAGDRQRQLLRSGGLDERTAPHVAELRAHERAELASAQRRALRYEPRRVSLFTALGRRLHPSRHAYPRGV
jgi:hypothetical protein